VAQYADAGSAIVLPAGMPSSYWLINQPSSSPTMKISNKIIGETSTVDSNNGSRKSFMDARGSPALASITESPIIALLPSQFEKPLGHHLTLCMHTRGLASRA
jgi:hypothetical protein